MKSVLKLSVLAWAGVSTVRAGWLLRGGVSGPRRIALSLSFGFGDRDKDGHK